MAVVVDAVGTETHTAPGTSATYTGITVGSGANRALVVAIVWGTGTGDPTGRSVTWDSGGTNQAMTEIVFRGTGGNTSVGIYGLVAPTSGNKTLAVSWTVSNESFIGAISFTGVDQTGGATSFPNSATSGTVATLTITSSANDYVVCCYGSGTGIGTPTDTVIFDDSVSGTFINAAAEYGVGSASKVIGTSVTVTQIAATDVAVYPILYLPYSTIKMYPGEASPNDIRLRGPALPAAAKPFGRGYIYSS